MKEANALKESSSGTLVCTMKGEVVSLLSAMVCAPHVSKKERSHVITDNQKALFELLKASLFKIEPKFPDKTSWKDVYAEAIGQTVVGLCFPAVTASAVIPQEVKAEWSIAAQENQVRFIRILHEQSNLVKLFQEDKIPIVILKGCAAAIYYPKPSLRTFGDVDFLVAPDRFEQAKELMEVNGYRYMGDNIRHIVYEKNGIILEMHRRFSGKSSDIESYLVDGLKQVTFQEIYGCTFPVMPVEINGLVLLKHICQHIKNGFNSLGLRQIIDWMMFVNAELDDTAWSNRYQALFRETGFETMAITMTSLCKKYFGLTGNITWCSSADAELVDMILDYVIECGNFGRNIKKNDRSIERALEGLKNEGTFRHLQRKGLINWKAAQDHPVLRPFAWIYQTGRYMTRGVYGLLNGRALREDLNRGSVREKIYKGLGI